LQQIDDELINFHLDDLIKGGAIIAVML